MTGRRAVRWLASAVLAGLLTACAGGTDTANHTPSIFAPPPPPEPRPAVPLGDTLQLDRIGGGREAVTLTGLINPATVAFGFGNTGKNYLAAELAIQNLGTTTIVGDTNNNLALIGSDQQVYRADLATVTECTNFTLGQYVLPPQGSARGCVVFGLPPGVSPAKVRYSPSSGISRDVGEWIVGAALP